MTHNWKIAQREYDRQLARRGRLHAYETLDPTSTVLIVVDMVPFFSGQNPYCRGIIPAVNALATALRSAGGVVAWVLPGADPHPALALEFNGAQGAEAYRNSGGEGPLPSRLSSDLAHEACDLFVEKTAASAFFPGHCRLLDLLAGRAIRTVIVAGTVTNVCCESTARDARTLGYRVIMAADANAARTDAEHNATLHTIYRAFGDVRPTAEILDMIAAG